MDGCEGMANDMSNEFDSDERQAVGTSSENELCFMYDVDAEEDRLFRYLLELIWIKEIIQREPQRFRLMMQHIDQEIQITKLTIAAYRQNPYATYQLRFS
ncbi:unnamed protein product [Soboliphyme baturini]|uniref:BESS domain-containing protein n=1 Tax=Soboliphyme baturini TaxID=241478 RepID=A0A183INU2_9BILA|nr:unnamed protein product [Soboliphyme baturini]